MRKAIRSSGSGGSIATAALFGGVLLGLGCPATSTAAAADFPTGPGSLSGVWVKATENFGSVNAPEMYEPRDTVLKTGDGSPLPTLPWAKALVEQRLQDAEAGHPFASTKSRCLPGGVPDMMFGSGPMQILETPGQVTVLREEFTFFRIIHVGGAHPADPDPTLLGDSVGHWEGGVFVVDTIGVSDKTTIREVIPHTEAMHVVERYRRTGKDSMEIVGTIDDPKTFTKPWTMVTHLRRLNEGLTQYFCENNRNAPDSSGHVASGAVARP
jgi:hypothetical protein